LIAFDTNILVYTLDVRSPERHARAGQVVSTALLRGTALLPLQVLAEFQHVAVRKLGLAPADALRAVETWSTAAAVEPYGIADLRSAAVAQAEHGLPLWDALIWAVCDRTGVEVLASEDFQNGRRLGRVTFLSPFDPANAARFGLSASG
jgi:predicted nucleic acid-binding protein